MQNDNPATIFVQGMNRILNELLAEVEQLPPTTEYERGFKAGVISLATHFTDAFSRLNYTGE